MSAGDHYGAALVRIYGDGEVRGAGFLLDHDLVITCAHLISDRTAPVRLDFPLLPGTPSVEGEVVRWEPVADNGVGDVAVLKVKAPDASRPVPVASSGDVWGHGFIACGFPRHFQHGLWSSGTLRGALGTGWVQMEADENIGPGFSGAPVWDEDAGGVVGMVVAIARNGKAAFFIAGTALGAEWARRATARHAVGDVNSGLLDDRKDSSKLLRYALPLGQRVQLDEAGFLLNPGDPRWMSEGGELPTRVYDLPPRSRHFALLGAAGAGKSTTVEALSRYEIRANYVDTAALERSDLERTITSARVTPMSAVYLDGLDQAALDDPRLLRWLAGRLAEDGASDVPWRLVCRSATWRGSAPGTIKQTLRNFLEWKLLPLDRAGAEAMLIAVGFDAAAFLEALTAAGMGRLSACAGRLLSTALFWRERGHLPTSSVEAMQFEIEGFLVESNADVASTMPLDMATRIAKRLGAFTAFSGAQSISLAAHDVTATLSVDRLPSDPEPANLAREVLPEDYREVLTRTALFDVRASGVMSFLHQMHVEYLAAAYLVDRDAVPDQVASLLGTEANGTLPASRIGVASWLAALRPSLVEGLIADNVSLFVSASAIVELPSDEARELVVEALLDAATRDEAPPEWGNDLSALTHARLVDQLERHLEGEAVTSQTLWWSAHLALAGRCSRLARAFALMAQDSNRFAYARRAAVIAADELGDDAVRQSLRVLLDSAGDEDNEVLSTVVDVLYPRLMSTEDLAQALRPHRSLLYGNYRVTLRELANRVPVDDLATFIRAFLTRFDNAETIADYYDLPAELMRRAWLHADTPEVRRALAALLVASIETHHWHRMVGPERAVSFDEPTNRRRALAVEVAGIEPAQWHRVITARLLSNDDAEWLLEALPTLPESAREPLARCFPLLLQDVPAGIADRVLALDPKHPAYETTTHLREVVPLDSPWAIQQREIVTEEEAFEQANAAQRQMVQDQAVAVLNRTEAEPDRWWQFSQNLAALDSDHQVGEDLTVRPGWTHLAESQRTIALKSGIRFLESYTPRPERWCGSSTLGLGDIGPDWEGVHLLSTLVAHEPGLLVGLGTATWAKWAHAIVATWTSHKGNDTALRSALLDRALEVARTEIIMAAIGHLDDLNVGGAHLSPIPVYQHLMPHFADRIAEGVTSGRYHGELTAGLLDVIVSHGPRGLALEICRALVNDRQKVVAAKARAHLAALTPALIVDEFVTNPPSAEAVAEIASHLTIANLDREHLVKAADILLRTFPYVDDPPLEGSFVYTPRHYARNLRSNLLQQLAIDGCVSEIELLRQGRSQHDYDLITMTYLRTARARQAELLLPLTTPQELIRLLTHDEARLVRNDTDLIRFLVRRLSRLEDAIQSDGRFREIWNGDQPQGEDDITDWLKRMVEDPRTTSLAVNREFHVLRRANYGIGTRADLMIKVYDSSGEVASICVEAKHANNPQVLTAMRAQLIDQYLLPLRRRHGLYIVYWIKPEQRPAGWSRTRFTDKDALLAELQQQADDARSRGVHITAYVLDISRP